MKCQNCKADLPSDYLDAEGFKKTFKVGDVVSAWSTGKKVVITAIGETRILHRNIDTETGVWNKEKVSSMRLPWRKIK